MVINNKVIICWGKYYHTQNQTVTITPAIIINKLTAMACIGDRATSCDEWYSIKINSNKTITIYSYATAHNCYYVIIGY